MEVIPETVPASSGSSSGSRPKPTSLSELPLRRAQLLPPENLEPGEYSKAQNIAISLQQLQYALTFRHINYEQFKIIAHEIEEMMDFTLQDNVNSTTYLTLTDDLFLQWTLAESEYLASRPRAPLQKLGAAVQAIRSGQGAEQVLKDYELLNPLDVAEIQEQAAIINSTGSLRVSRASEAAAQYRSQQTTRPSLKQPPDRPTPGDFVQAQISTRPLPVNSGRISKVARRPGAPNSLAHAPNSSLQTEAHHPSGTTGLRAPPSRLGAAIDDIVRDGRPIWGAMEAYELTHPDDIAQLKKAQRWVYDNSRRPR